MALLATIIHVQWNLRIMDMMDKLMHHAAWILVHYSEVVLYWGILVQRPYTTL